MVEIKRIPEKGGIRRIGYMKKVEAQEKRKRFGHMRRIKKGWQSESESK